VRPHQSLERFRPYQRGVAGQNEQARAAARQDLQGLGHGVAGAELRPLHDCAHRERFRGRTHRVGLVADHHPDARRGGTASAR